MGELGISNFASTMRMLISRMTFLNLPEQQPMVSVLQASLSTEPISLLAQIIINPTSGLMVTTACARMTLFPPKNSLLKIMLLFFLNAHQNYFINEVIEAQRLIYFT